MKTFKQFNTDSEEVESTDESAPGLGSSHQDQERDAWYKGDDHHANWKKANPNVNKKEKPVKRQGPSKKDLTTGIAGQKGNTGRNEKE